MEERKRPASNEDGDHAPPLKRQATSKDTKVSKGQDSDIAGRDENLEKFKKEAIYRQLLEYKREKQTLEGRLKELEKSAAYHDEHVRTIDSALEQLLDEIRLSLTSSTPSTSYTPLSSQLLSSDIEVFKEHLSARSTSISAAIKSIAAQDEDTKPETEELSAQLSQRLAAEKDHLNKLEALRQEQESLEKRLETATSRYMLAEKKLDRAKSATVAKLEAQAMATSQAQSSSPVEGSSSIEQNGTAVDSAALSRAEEAREQAEAASAKQKEQLELIAAENEKLTAQLTAASSKPNTFTDDDYAKTDLFKQLKMQHEDVIKRVNDLEATNIELRKEAERLQAERTLNRNQLENEHSGPSSEKDLMIGRLEADLARIRSARDELHTKVQVQEQSDEQERTSIAQLKQFSEAKEERIRSLEAEIERLSAQPTDTGIEDLSPEETKTKFATLQKQYTMLMEELQGAGAAYKKLQASASAKINSQVELEDRAKRALAEKNKADQKYFATLKTKDTFRSEVVALRAQASKSSDLILQLREADQSSKSLITNLEAEIAKTKELLDQSTRHSSKAQAELAEHVAGTSSLRSQMGDLRAQLEAKDAIVNDVRNAKRKAEVEVEELRVSVRDRDKKLEASKKSKSAGGADSETEMLRALAMCTVCRHNFKNAAITTCGHTMCEACVQERISSRSRKCPHCNKSFGRNEYMKITLN